MKKIVAVIGDDRSGKKGTRLLAQSLAKNPSIIVVDNREEYREKFWAKEKEKARKRRQIEIAKMIETVAV